MTLRFLLLIAFLSRDDGAWSPLVRPGLGGCAMLHSDVDSSTSGKEEACHHP